MDLAPEELQFLSIPDVLKESISIPKQSPKTFYLITLTLIFPPFLRHLSSLTLHAPHPGPAPNRSRRRLLRLVQAPDFPVLLPHIPLRVLPSVHRRRGLHRCVAIHLQARFFLLHNRGDTQRF